MSADSDRIEKKITLRAPLARVWRAIGDSKEFGAWFGVELEGAFTPGALLRGRIVPTKADPEVAELQKPHEGKTFELTIDRVEPERLFSFRWHPFAVDSTVDYASEPATLVVFELEAVAGGTLLTVTETGFDKIPLARRAKAFAANDRGWELQSRLIEKYLADAA